MAKKLSGQTVDQKARKALLKELKEDGSALEHCSAQLQNDPSVVMAAVVVVVVVCFLFCVF